MCVHLYLFTSCFPFSGQWSISCGFVVVWMSATSVNTFSFYSVVNMAFTVFVLSTVRVSLKFKVSASLWADLGSALASARWQTWLWGWSRAGVMCQFFICCFLSSCCSEWVQLQRLFRSVAWTVTSSERGRERVRQKGGKRGNKERERERDTERVGVRKTEAILGPRWHVCLHFAPSRLDAALGGTLGEVETGKSVWGSKTWRQLFICFSVSL